MKRKSYVPFNRPWLNDNQDLNNPAGGSPSGVDEQTEAETPAALDSSNSLIKVARDLEDFSRVQFKYSAIGNVKSVTFQFSDTGGTAPEIKLFEAPTLNDDYLFNESVSENLTLPTTGTQPIDIASTQSTTVPLPSALQVPNLFVGNVSNGAVQSYILPFLFEGVSAGHGNLIATFKDANGNALATSSVWLDLKHIADMYETWNAADDAVTRGQFATGPITPSHPYGAPQTDADKDYILFVHGWNNTPTDRIETANTTFKRLFWSGYQGRFGAFFWPTDWVWASGSSLNDAAAMVLDPANYNRSEFTAYQAGSKLRDVLQTLYGTYHATDGSSGVRLLSHSMGAVVSSEALRIESIQSVPQKLVQVYVASQGAMDAGAYDGLVPDREGSADGNPGGWDTPDWYKKVNGTGDPYFANIGKAANDIVNFYNPQDYALSAGWIKVQNLKPAIAYSWDPDLSKFTAGGSVMVGLDAIYAFADEGHSLPVGRQEGMGGPFDIRKATNLDATFGFGGSSVSSHSAQFMGDMAIRQGYWQLLLQVMTIPDSRRWNFALQSPSFTWMN